MIIDRIPLSPLQPITTNVGASSGPRVSTAGYKWYQGIRGGGTFVVRVYADLDGHLWQEDWDVLRRGAHAIVPFTSRAVAAIRAGKALVDTGPIKNQPGWYRTTLQFEDCPEQYARRVSCFAEFRADEEITLAELAEREQHWVREFDATIRKIGPALHVGVNDNRNRKLFHGSAAA